MFILLFSGFCDVLYIQAVPDFSHNVPIFCWTFLSQVEYMYIALILIGNHWSSFFSNSNRSEIPSHVNSFTSHVFPCPRSIIWPPFCVWKLGAITWWPSLYCCSWWFWALVSWTLERIVWGKLNDRLHPWLTTCFCYQHFHAYRYT